MCILSVLMDGPSVHHWWTAVLLTIEKRWETGTKKKNRLSTEGRGSEIVTQFRLTFLSVTDGCPFCWRLRLTFTLLWQHKCTFFEYALYVYWFASKPLVVFFLLNLGEIIYIQSCLMRLFACWNLYNKVSIIFAQMFDLGDLLWIP